MSKKLLIIGFVWPEPTSSAAGTRMLQIIHFFLEKKYKVTFASTSSKSERSFNLPAINVNEKSITLNDSSFDIYIGELKPDIVLFDRFMIEEQFGWRVAEQCPTALRILDTEDLHFLRKARELSLENDESLLEGFLYNDTTKREIASIYRSDFSLIISEAEMRILNNTFKIDPLLLFYFPLLIENIDDDALSKKPSYGERKDFVTIGNFKHPPNLDAVFYLKNEIWPLIRKSLPDAVLKVYGAYPSAKVLKLHDESNGFLIEGQAISVTEIMKSARISLAPLRFGAGIKGKVLVSFINGTPCVMTTIGAEGILEESINHNCVTDDPNEFANKAVKIYSQIELWEECQREGVKTLNLKFDKLVHQKALANQLEYFTENLNQHRQNNFIGQILSHHALQSTKYMSRWIEEKNKKL